MKIGIIYGSSTGNTKKVGEIIKAELKNHQVQMINVADVKDGDLQTDFRRYIDEISPELIGNKQVAVFGCGDNWGFPLYFVRLLIP